MMAHMIGKELEPFSVMGYHQGEFKPFTEKDLLGRWSVLFFYPADFTFVCPTELKDLAEQYAGFQAEGCEVYSVSEDTHFVHKAWADASATIRPFPTPCWATRRGCWPVSSACWWRRRARPCGAPFC